MSTKEAILLVSSLIVSDTIVTCCDVRSIFSSGIGLISSSVVESIPSIDSFRKSDTDGETIEPSTEKSN